MLNDLCIQIIMKYITDTVHTSVFPVLGGGGCLREGGCFGEGHVCVWGLGGKCVFWLRGGVFFLGGGGPTEKGGDAYLGVSFISYLSVSCL